jgi:23S rRNA (cytidine1920-2'-O)/16S rRNA (cytidine1409-2'-O)-methyltransferase
MFNFQFSNKETNTEARVREFLHNKVAIDVGSSTGGFTDFLLQYGIAHVDAVDVGTSQLHEKVRSDGRVSVYENMDIRDFVSDTLYDVIVADLSFISLESVFEKIVSFGKEGALCFLLIKPQFEVGKGNTKKGVVKDAELVDVLLEKYRYIGERLLDAVRIVPCVITGGDGNQEYFLVGRNRSKQQTVSSDQ